LIIILRGDEYVEKTGCLSSTGNPQCMDVSDFRVVLSKNMQHLPKNVNNRSWFTVAKPNLFRSKAVILILIPWKLWVYKPGTGQERAAVKIYGAMVIRGFLIFFN